MDSDNIVPDEETILNNIKKIYKGNWNVVLDYYRDVLMDDEWDYDSVCYFAAWKGHLEVLKYAHENGCPWNEWTCSNAAFNGHLEALKYAHENECPWNENTCSGATANGHLEVLKYAHENGCPWNDWSCSNAALYGHLEVLYYLYENEAPYGIYNDVHESCEEFFDTYGEYWKKGDYTLNHSHLKPAKN